MPPHNNDTFIVGMYIEKLGDVVDGNSYVIITKNQEMVYKRLDRNGKNAFTANSDDDFYSPYPVKFSDIAEIWEYAGSLEQGIFKPLKKEVQPLESVIRKMQRDIFGIREKVL